MDTGHWEHYSHPADIGIRGLGPTREEAFAQAALALTAVITDPKDVEPRETVEMLCRGDDDELLLYDWLSSLLYEMDTRGMLFGRFELEVIEAGLKAVAWGERIDPNRHTLTVEVKAATFADLKACPDETGTWVAQCIVDV